MRQVLLSLLTEVVARDDELRAKDALLEQHERDAAFKQVLIDKLTSRNTCAFVPTTTQSRSRTGNSSNATRTEPPTKKRFITDV